MKPIIAPIAFSLCMCSWLAYGGKTMTMDVGDSKSTFEVTLPANPTTGYQWSVKQFNHDVLQLKSQQYIAPKTRLMGAGGHTHFIFQLLEKKSHPKQTEILFSYARPWEPSSANLTKVIVKFH